MTADKELIYFPKPEDRGSEYILCDLCGQTVLRREQHNAACGLPCAFGKLYLDDEVWHDQDCPLCL